MAGKRESATIRRPYINQASAKNGIMAETRNRRAVAKMSAMACAWRIENWA